ncbi:MAG: hypothetical protein LUQ25_04145, partial [Methanoregulaceae archaeon]|nr:hypothetical protein [Methanoregulaceae archaeon]
MHIPMGGMVTKKMTSFTYLVWFAALAMFVSFVGVPVQAAVPAPAPDSLYRNPYPDLVYGSQFAAPGLIADPKWGPVGFSDQNGRITDLWYFEFWLTPAQHDQLHRMRTERWVMPILEAMNILVPEQVAALPANLKWWIAEDATQPYRPHCSSFTIVPFEQGVPLYAAVN